MPKNIHDGGNGVVVPKAGLEPARGITPLVFESSPRGIAYFPVSCDKPQQTAWLSHSLTFIVLWLVVGMRIDRRE